MAREIEVLMPYGESPAAPGAAPTLAPRLRTLAGATVGVVWNGWHCMEVIKDQLVRLLVDEYGVREVVGVQTGTTIPLTAARMADARERWDAAIIGLAT